MRCTQFYGLVDRARALVAGSAVPAYTAVEVRCFPDGRVETTGPYVVSVSDVEADVVGIVEGMFGEPAGALHRYRFADGRVWVEYVQAEIWSSGPMIFVALRDDDTGAPVPESLWTADDEPELAGYLDDSGADDTDEESRW